MIQQPALGASPATVANPCSQTAFVTIIGGTVSSINVPAGGTQVATSSPFMATVPAGSSVGVTYSVIPTGFWWSTFTPAIAATTVAVPNNTGKNITVVLAGGTTTHITVNGTDRATTTPAQVRLPAGGSIAITYSAAPVWAWLDYIDQGWLDSLGTAYMASDLVNPTGVSGYSPLSALVYPVHSGASMAGLCAGVSN